jgi:cobalt-zinc-cadmium efflux system membrane fusion protein
LISAEQARAAGISIETAWPATISETVTLYGTIKTNAEREQDLRARYPGVVRVVAKRPGEAATKGETLLTVEANESLQTYAIHAPISGRVLERNVNPGQSVGTDAILMKVADLGSVWAEFAVFTRELGRVRTGLPIQVKGSDNAQSESATVSYVAPAGDGDSQSVVGRAVLENASGKWIPGQFVTVDVAISQVSAFVAVKPAALQEINGKTVVFVQTPRGFIAREVSVGKRSRNAVEIIRGLRVGDRYAATYSYLI